MISPDESAALSVPDYDLLRRIGRGAYGDVWLARNLTGQYRAVKLVWRRRFEDQTPYEREFKGLTQFAAISIAEPRQLALLHVGRNDDAGYFYYVMELADDAELGRDIVPDKYVPHTLREMRARRGRLPAAEVVRLGVELARALLQLHERDLVHRDIKPSNVILVGGIPKLADIGLVAEASEALSFVGTEGYIPTEGPGTPSADVFSLGKVLYELSTGRDRKEFPRLPDALESMPDCREVLELNAVILRACDADPARRYSGAGPLLDDLLLLQAGKSVRRLRRIEKRLASMQRVGWGALVVVIVALITSYSQHRFALAEARLRYERDRELYQARLSLAQSEIAADRFGRAREFLETALPKEPGRGQPLSGFEFDALRFEAEGDAAQILRRESPRTDVLRFSPDGRHLAAHTFDGPLQLWRPDGSTLATYPSIRRFGGFAPDGASFWMVTTGGVLRHCFLDPSRPSRDLAGEVGRFRTARQAWVGVAYQREARFMEVWDLAADVVHHRFELPERPGLDRIRFCVLSDDGAVVATVRGGSTVREGRMELAAWRTSSAGQAAPLWNREIMEGVADLEISADGRNLTVGWMQTNVLSRLDLATGDTVWSRRAHVGTLQALAHSPDGECLASGGDDRAVALRRAADGEPLDVLRGFGQSVLALAWDPVGHRLAVSGSESEVRVYPWPNRRLAMSTDGLWARPGGSLIVSGSARLLAVTSAAGDVRVLDSESLRDAVPPLRDAYEPIGFGPDSRQVFTLDRAGAVWAWPLADGAPAEIVVPPWAGERRTVATVNDRGTRLIVGGEKGSLELWDLEQRRLVAHWQLAGILWCVTLLPDGLEAVAAGDAGRVWRLAAGSETPLSVRDIGRPLYALSATPDGRQVAIGDDRADVHVLELPDLRTAAGFRTSGSRARSLAFSPDGRRLAIGGAAGEVQVFATSEWNERALLRVDAANGGIRDDNVFALRFAPDGRFLAGFTSGGMLRLWRVR